MTTRYLSVFLGLLLAGQSSAQQAPIAAPITVPATPVTPPSSTDSGAPVAGSAVLGSAVLGSAVLGSAVAGSADAGVAAYGRGDYPAALSVFRPRAENGDATAQFYLGYMYMLGDGLTQDYRLAKSWCQKAADQNSLTGQDNVG